MPSIKGLRPQALKELLASIATAPPSVFADVSIDLLLSSAAALERAAVAPRTTRYINVESATDFEATDNPIVASTPVTMLVNPRALHSLISMIA